MTKYVFDNTVFLNNGAKLDPQKIGEAIEQIPEADRTPRALWEAAKSPRHPAHKAFTWDIEKAAEKCWDDEARGLYQSIRVVADKSEPAVRGFISVRSDDGRRYHTRQEVFTSSHLQLTLVKQIDREFIALRKRASDLIDICELIDTARARLAKVIVEIQKQIDEAA